MAIKNTELKQIGKNSIIPLKKEFDTVEEGRAFIEANLADQFTYDYDSHCIGWQYDLGADQVDLEDIEGHASIEFKSQTDEGLKKLFELFAIDPALAIKGPSVVAVRELLKKA